MNLKSYCWTCWPLVATFVAVCLINRLDAAGPHVHGPVVESDPHRCAGCADGLCAPSSRYGYYRTNWRRWPGASDYLGVGGPRPVSGTPGLEVPDAINEARFDTRTRSNEEAVGDVVLPPPATTEGDPFETVPEEEAPDFGGSEPIDSESQMPPLGGFGDPGSVPGFEAEPAFTPDAGDDTPLDNMPETDFPGLDFELDDPPALNDGLDLGMLQRDTILPQNSRNRPLRGSAELLASQTYEEPEMPAELPIGLAADAIFSNATSGEAKTEQVSFNQVLAPDTSVEPITTSSNPLRGRLRRADNAPDRIVVADPDLDVSLGPNETTLAQANVSVADVAPRRTKVLEARRSLRSTLRKNPLR